MMIKCAVSHQYNASQAQPTNLSEKSILSMPGGAFLKVTRSNLYGKGVIVAVF